MILQELISENSGLSIGLGITLFGLILAVFTVHMKSIQRLTRLEGKADDLDRIEQAVRENTNILTEVKVIAEALKSIHARLRKIENKLEI